MQMNGWQSLSTAAPEDPEIAASEIEAREEASDDAISGRVQNFNLVSEEVEGCVESSLHKKMEQDLEDHTRGQSYQGVVHTPELKTLLLTRVDNLHTALDPLSSITCTCTCIGLTSCILIS